MSLVSWIFSALRIPCTWITCTECVGRALDTAAIRTGDRYSAGSLDLLEAVLEIEDSGLRRLFDSLGGVSQGVLSETASALRGERGLDRLCLSVLRDSYPVVPVTAIQLVTEGGGIVNRKQLLHSAHLLWGFTRTRRSDAARLLARRGLDHERVSRVADSLSDFPDPG